MGFGHKFIAPLLVASGFAVSGSASVPPDCIESIVSLRGDWGQAQFVVEIADDRAERAQGLMNRRSMARSAGMLFIYEEPQSVSFWMGNTLIALDMIFVDETGLVVRVHQNAVPMDLTPIPGGDGVLMVLEINGGLAATYGIEAGNELRHPMLNQDTAIWRCTGG
ncbi:DUF192 domain-containing protein [Rhodobacteraceae bacterium R_SAG10]|jgi:uncharacterized membrane protein (UPF0127 family)|nr:DUF192 domain-containing protein [Rhodobacteraceae bacterium R_SAG10]